MRGGSSLHRLSFAFFFLLLIGLSNCAGTSASKNALSTVTISGVASLGLLSNATVQVYTVGSDGGNLATLGEPTLTDANGNYSVQVPLGITAAIRVTISGGTYLDESSQQTIPNTSRITAIASAPAGTSLQLCVSPITTVGDQLATSLLGQGSSLDSAISIAYTNTATFFNLPAGTDPRNTPPINYQNGNSVSQASSAQLAVTSALAGLSQLATTQGGSSSSTGQLTLVGQIALALAAGNSTQLSIDQNQATQDWLNGPANTQHITGPSPAKPTDTPTATATPTVSLTATTAPPTATATPTQTASATPTATATAAPTCSSTGTMLDTFGPMAPVADGSGRLYAIFIQNGWQKIGRFLPTGQLDCTFTPVLGPLSSNNVIYPTSDGSGNFYFRATDNTDTYYFNNLYHAFADGAVDTAFNGSGAPLTEAFTIFPVLPAADGSGDVYVGGNFQQYQGATVANLIRIHADGTLDTTFATGTGFNNPVEALALANDGTQGIVAAGGFTTYNGNAADQMIKLNPDGSVNSGFSSPGFPSGAIVSNLVSDPSGRIYVGGNWGGPNLRRLTSAGVIDTTFQSSPGTSDSIFAMALAIDGSESLFIGGDFKTYNGTGTRSLAKILSNGTLDPNFQDGNGFEQGYSYDNYNVVYNIVPNADGSVFVGGQLTKFDSTTVTELIKLGASGNLVTPGLFH